MLRIGTRILGDFSQEFLLVLYPSSYSFPTEGLPVHILAPPQEETDVADDSVLVRLTKGAGRRSCCCGPAVVLG